MTNALTANRLYEHDMIPVRDIEVSALELIFDSFDLLTYRTIFFDVFNLPAQ